MSGGFYRLLRADSQSGDDPEESRAWNSSTSNPDALIRIRTASISRYPRYPLEPLSSPRRISRDSSSSVVSSILSPVKRRRPRLWLFASIFVGLFITLFILGAHWDQVDSFYHLPFLIATPSNTCLLDRSSPASYVHWDPKSKGKGSIYHCITQREPQFGNHALALPVGSSIRPYRPLPADCIDSYYTNGTSCSDGQRTTFDIIWTWVNGSDPMIREARAKALAALIHESEDSEDFEDDDTNAYLYRDHDELRHSLRSVLQYFRRSANRFLILTSDFDFPVTYSPIKYLLGLSKRSIPEKRSLKPGQRRQLQRRGAVAYDDDFQGDEYDEDPYTFARLGLLPQWLKFNLGAEDLQTNQGSEPMRYDADKRTQGMGRWKDGNVTLEVVHHAEVFDDYDGTVFNSNSIESQLGNLAGNKAFIYFNDDCFFNAPLSSADFHSSQFGLVFRLVAYPWFLVNPHHYPGDSGMGEWHPMEYTSYLISQRFGIRRRPYTMHQVKVLQGGLMREMWDMWRDQEALNRGHKFRGLGGLTEILGDHTWADDVDPLEPEPEERDDEEDDELEGSQIRQDKRMGKRDSVLDNIPPSLVRRKKHSVLDEMEDDLPSADGSSIDDDGDAHVIFLFTHFIIERSREGMLWSWIVANLGGDNDEFGLSQRNNAWRVLTEDAQAEQLGGGVLEVHVERRKTTEPWRVRSALEEVGDTLEGSQYRFSSQDGYAYSFYDDVHGLEWWHDGSTYWPLLHDENNFGPDPASRPSWSRCTIDWNTCFNPEIKSASGIFKKIAFEEVECGNCILKALVRASGDLGLSALLPPSDRVYRGHIPSRPLTSPKPVRVGENDIPPHLPLAHKWQGTDFSLAAVFASGFWGVEEGVNLRDWVQRMLERYRYVIADTDNYFTMVRNPVDAEAAFAYVDDHPKISLLTLNDNVNEYPEQTDLRMREWFDRRWSTPAAWEDPELTPQISPKFDSIHRKRSHHGWR